VGLSPQGFRGHTERARSPWELKDPTRRPRSPPEGRGLRLGRPGHSDGSRVSNPGGVTESPHWQPPEVPPQLFSQPLIGTTDCLPVPLDSQVLQKCHWHPGLTLFSSDLKHINCIVSPDKLQPPPLFQLCISCFARNYKPFPLVEYLL
jgi:hypothetical protein